MPNEWRKTKLNDVVDLKTGFPFKSDDYLTEGYGYKLLRGDNVVQSAFRWENVKLFPKEKITNKHKEFWLKDSDVVLAMDRPWIDAGLKFAQITKYDLPCLLVQRVSCLRAKNSFDQNFLRYLISSYDFVSYVKSVQTGTAVPHISGKQILDFEFLSPPQEIQIRIGFLLRVLDDKIELNRQMNVTLEAMAQALFKSWFVDFDPVIDNALAAGNPIPDELEAKAAARQALGDARKPLPEDIRSLFPNAFVFTEEMGWIPEGWGIGVLEDHCEIIMGQSPKGESYNVLGIGTPLVNGPVEFGEYFTERMKWTTEPTKYSKNNDLVVCVRGSTTGRYVKSDGVYCLGRGVCALRGKSSQAFVDQLFKNALPDFLRYTTGSTFPSWNTPTIKAFLSIKPAKKVVDQFDKKISLILDKQGELTKSNVTLSNLRDTLLPKLLSGELRIPEAAELVEKAIA